MGSHLIFFLCAQILQSSIAQAFSTLRHCCHSPCPITPERRKILPQSTTSIRIHQEFFLHESSSDNEETQIKADDPDEVQDESSSTSKHTFSKVKWKRKRHLMMQDVVTLTKAGDPKAPRKAQEMISRMQKLSAFYNDEELRPNIQVYNVRSVFSIKTAKLWLSANFLPCLQSACSSG